MASKANDRVLRNLTVGQACGCIALNGRHAHSHGTQRGVDSLEVWRAYISPLGKSPLSVQPLSCAAERPRGLML